MNLLMFLIEDHQIAESSSRGNTSEQQHHRVLVLIPVPDDDHRRMLNNEGTVVRLLESFLKGVVACWRLS